MWSLDYVELPTFYPQLNAMFYTKPATLAHLWCEHNVNTMKLLANCLKLLLVVIAEVSLGDNGQDLPLGDSKFQSL